MKRSSQDGENFVTQSVQITSEYLNNLASPYVAPSLEALLIPLKQEINPISSLDSEFSISELQ